MTARPRLPSWSLRRHPRGRAVADRAALARVLAGLKPTALALRAADRGEVGVTTADHPSPRPSRAIPGDEIPGSTLSAAQRSSSSSSESCRAAIVTCGRPGMPTVRSALNARCGNAPVIGLFAFAEFGTVGDRWASYRRQFVSAYKTQAGRSPLKFNDLHNDPLSSSGFPSWTSPVRVRSPALWKSQDSKQSEHAGGHRPQRLFVGPLWGQLDRAEVRRRFGLELPGRPASIHLVTVSTRVSSLDRRATARQCDNARSRPQ
jgi:hypothetical protein